MRALALFWMGRQHALQGLPLLSEVPANDPLPKNGLQALPWHGCGYIVSTNEGVFGGHEINKGQQNVRIPMCRNVADNC